MMESTRGPSAPQMSVGCAGIVGLRELVAGAGGALRHPGWNRWSGWRYYGAPRAVLSDNRACFGSRKGLTLSRVGLADGQVSYLLSSAGCAMPLEDCYAGDDAFHDFARACAPAWAGCTCQEA